MSGGGGLGFLAVSLRTMSPMRPAKTSIVPDHCIPLSEFAGFRKIEYSVEKIEQMWAYKSVIMQKIIDAKTSGLWPEVEYHTFDADDNS